MHACVVDQSQKGVALHARPDLRCCLVNCGLIRHIKEQRSEEIPKLPLQPLCICLLPHAALGEVQF